MKTIKVDAVDFYDGFDKNRCWAINLLRKHYNIEFSDTPDFLFYSCYGNKYKSYKNCVKIFYTGENVLPDFNQCDYGIGFDYLDFGDRYFRMYYNDLPPKNTNNRSMITEDFAKRRFCNFIYSNATSGEGAVLRQNFCKKLMEYKQVDCPGKILHNMDSDELEPRDGDWIKSKIDFLKKYKFTIAFENSCSDGYTTEKLFQPLESMSISIYYGNPLIVRDINPKSFINCNDYNNDFNAIIERIKYLDTHDDEYLAMLREPPMLPTFDFNRDAKLEQWLCNIIEKGNKPFNKDPRGWSAVPHRQEITALTNENAKLKSDIERFSNTAILFQKVDDLTAQQANIDKHIAEFSNQIDTKINDFNSLLNHLITKETKNHKKIRNKYFIVLFATQFLLFMLILFGVIL